MNMEFFTSVYASIRRALSSLIERSEMSLNSRWTRIAAVLVLSLVVASITSLSIQRLPSVLEEGSIANRDIKADRNYEIIDEEVTRAARDEAMATVPAVYDFDEGKADELASHLEEAFAAARDQISSDEPKLRADFETAVGVKLSDDDWRTLYMDGFSEKARSTVADMIRSAMTRPVVSDRTEFLNDKDRGIVIRRIGRIGDEMVLGDEWPLTDFNSVVSLDDAKTKIDAQKIRIDAARGASLTKVLRSLARLTISPNLSFDKLETDIRRNKAAQNVKPAIIKIKAGEIIIRDGSRYEKSQIKILKGIEKERDSGALSHEFFGTWLLAVLIISVPFFFARKAISRVKPVKSDYLLMSLVGFVVLAMIRIMMAVFPVLREDIFSQVPATAFVYLIPVAGGAMLIRMLLNAETTMVFSVVLGMLCALFDQTDAQFMTFVIVSSFTGIVAIAHVDRRALIMQAGLITGLVNILIVFAIRLVSMVSAAESITVSDVLWSSLFGFMGGFGNAIFVMIAAPIVESVMNYTTDIKLLEMANLNHTLLRELIVSAPGTYHHSHLVGILGEAAAESIGANALLVRVGAYYHDIGKMKKPQYFVENARNGENRHDKLTPSMSALIIQAHVKDGIEMAQYARLPKVIVDMIPQHHGTRMISFFYDKAKAMEKPDIQKVDPKDFQYEGPKPQTREAAILMLADVVEAQTRSLKEKSPARIEQTVRKVIDDVFRESQLDECELTLKDLDEIHRSFVRILLGIYHQRIEYPEKEEKTGEHLGSGAEGETTIPHADKEGAKTAGKSKKHQGT